MEKHPGQKNNLLKEGNLRLNRRLKLIKISKTRRADSAGKIKGIQTINHLNAFFHRACINLKRKVEVWLAGTATSEISYSKLDNYKPNIEVEFFLTSFSSLLISTLCNIIRRLIVFGIGEFTQKP